MQHLKPLINIEKPIPPNLASFLSEKRKKFSSHPVFAYFDGKNWVKISWESFYNSVLSIALSLKKEGFQKGNKMVIYSPNCLEMLMVELAVMSIGGIAVPIFAYFKKDTANMLIEFCDARFLTIYGEFQYLQLSDKLPIEKVFYIQKDLNPSSHTFSFIPFTSLLQENVSIKENILDFNASPDDICLNMYTSGTMGKPKCVQLTHQNILSQQVAMSYIWDINENDRFLSYLPWHHSFGGIFELFAALYNGATYHLEPSYGKDINSILQHWKIIQPTVFFSVPKIYNALIDQLTLSDELLTSFFHPNLKFIFTAAAPLPDKTASEFTKRNVRIMEGWGLTETSPCCTITDSEKGREAGVVGFPIPGVEIRLDEIGEIQVKGLNVMKGYYKNDEVNKEVFTEDGWFKTGDIGEITPKGLKLIARKDRIFKLSNGEKVIPTDIEKLIESKCCYIAYSLVYGSGKEYPVVILFPNKKILEHPNYELTPNDGCFCPRTLDELKRCLSGCLCQVNDEIKQKFSKIKIAAIIDSELSIDDNTLTPSLKPSPKNIIQKYFDKIKKLYDNQIPFDKDIYVIVLDNQLKNSLNYGGN
ncbi:MAG: AMP-dependent synthetase [Bacteroidia bacterium]|nr:MAG: AMP-dependent synthetase [Bacteroidia bacterium]